MKTKNVKMLKEDEGRQTAGVCHESSSSRKPLFVCSFLSVLILLSCSSAFGQANKLNRIWVGDTDNYLKIDSAWLTAELSWSFNGKKYFDRKDYAYTVVGDTMRIVDRYDPQMREAFILSFPSAGELKLVSLNPKFRLLAFSEVPKTVLRFRDPQVFTNKIDFEKIVFSSTTCYGRCPAQLFAIDKSGKMNFMGGDFAIKQGYHSSVLPKALYSELLQILARSDLDKLEDNREMNIDAPTYTLEVHYNQQVRFIKSAFFPNVLRDLLKYLSALPNRVELEPAGPMEIAFSR